MGEGTEREQALVEGGRLITRNAEFSSQSGDDFGKNFFRIVPIGSRLTISTDDNDVVTERLQL